MHDNKIRDNLDVGTASNLGSQDQVLLDKYGAPKTDLTDKEDRMFRYSW